MKRIHLLILLFILPFFAAAQKSNLRHSAGITLYNWKWIPEMPLVPSSAGADKFRLNGLNYQYHLSPGKKLRSTLQYLNLKETIVDQRSPEGYDWKGSIKGWETSLGYQYNVGWKHAGFLVAGDVYYRQYNVSAYQYTYSNFIRQKDTISLQQKYIGVGPSLGIYIRPYSRISLQLETSLLLRFNAGERAYYGGRSLDLHIPSNLSLLYNFGKIKPEQ